MTWQVVTTSGNLPLDIARQWWLNQPKILAARGTHRRERYPRRPSFGISANLFNYHNSNAQGYAVNQVISMNPTYYDTYSNGLESNILPTYPVFWQAWKTTAHLEGDDQLKMIAPFSRMRGDYYEGQTALRLAEAVLTAEMEKGFSPLLPQIKVFGYLLSLTVPADSGEMQVASIPADFPVAWYENYNLYSPAAAAAPPAIPAWFITLKGIYPSTNRGYQFVRRFNCG